MVSLLKNRSISFVNLLSRQVNDTSSNHIEQQIIHIPSNDVKPGWYFIEIALQSSQTFTGAVFTVEYDDFREEVHMPLKGGRVTKRLILIKQPPVNITFDLGEPIVELNFAQFKFDRTFSYKARSRMKRRLHNYGYRSRVSDMWEAYNNTFIAESLGGNYKYWICEIENKRLIPTGELDNGPSISVVILPGYGNIDDYLATLESIQAQYYEKIDVYLTCSHDSINPLSFSGKATIKIHYIYAPGVEAYELLNTALKQLTGELCVFIKAGDKLHTHGLLHIGEYYKKKDACILYGDDDQINKTGERVNPRFKPGWNPLYFFCYDYIADLIAVKISYIKGFTFSSCAEGVEISELLLWCLHRYDLTDRVVRIPRVLSHQQLDSKNDTHNNELINARKKLLESYFKQNNINICVERLNPVLKIAAPPADIEHSITLLIPTRDNCSVVRRCITSILEKTTYKNYEIFILNNQSVDPDTLDYFEEIRKHKRIRIIDYNHPFNFSAINNYGVSLSDSDLVCLLNDDTEVINSEWLSEMAAYAIQPEIGCVGAKLLYSNNKIQHGGVILGLGHVAGHTHRYFHGDSHGYINRLLCTQYVSAVTGACLLVRKKIYDEVGGLDDKHLTVAYNDVDFCIKVGQAGYKNVWTPHAQLYHYESISRGAEDTLRKKIRYWREVRYMHKKWGELLLDDPYYHPSLTTKREDFSLKF